MSNETSESALTVEARQYDVLLRDLGTALRIERIGAEALDQWDVGYNHGVSAAIGAARKALRQL